MQPKLHLRVCGVQTSFILSPGTGKSLFWPHWYFTFFSGENTKPDYFLHWMQRNKLFPFSRHWKKLISNAPFLEEINWNDSGTPIFHWTAFPKLACRISRLHRLVQSSVLNAPVGTKHCSNSSNCWFQIPYVSGTTLQRPNWARAPVTGIMTLQSIALCVCGTEEVVADQSINI